MASLRFNECRDLRNKIHNLIFDFYSNWFHLRKIRQGVEQEFCKMSFSNGKLNHFIEIGVTISTYLFSRSARVLRFKLTSFRSSELQGKKSWQNLHSLWCFLLQDRQQSSVLHQPSPRGPGGAPQGERRPDRQPQGRDLLWQEEEGDGPDTELHWNKCVFKKE